MRFLEIKYLKIKNSFQKLKKSISKINRNFSIFKILNCTGGYKSTFRLEKIENSLQLNLHKIWSRLSLLSCPSRMKLAFVYVLTKLDHMERMPRKFLEFSYFLNFRLDTDISESAIIVTV